MVKYAKSNSNKINNIITKYPKEFCKSSNNQLWCILCDNSVSFNKKSIVDNHRKSQKHEKALLSKVAPSSQVTLSKCHFIKDLVSTFLKLDIPLHKLRSDSLKCLLKKYNLPVPSQSTAIAMVETLSNGILGKVKHLVKDEPVFLIVEETSLGVLKYVNVLIGSLNRPNLSFLIDTRVLESSVNASIISQIIDDSIHSMQVKRENFRLLLSDAAPYMNCAGRTLKTLYQNLLQVNCIAHLVHNCALKVKDYFPRIDALISSTKASTIKNKTRRDKFVENVGQPPHPIIIRWSSWLSSVLYYSSSFHSIKELINSFNSDGLLSLRNKQAVNAEGLEHDLLLVTSCYVPLIKIIEMLERKELDIQTGYEAINSLNFNEDPVSIKKYISKRLKKNDITKIVMYEDIKIDPIYRHLLLKAQCTSIDVERSFSLLGKMLRKDRRFKNEKVKAYMICYFNKNID